MSFIFLRNRVTGGAAFTPASLFSSGEEGAWYEPSTTTAFRSTTDLTPCGYGGTDGVCGFLLDLSKGAGYSGGSFTGLGSELVLNGTFLTDTSGWTATNCIATVSGGQVTLTNTSTSTGTLHRPITTVVGKTYFVTADYLGGTVTPSQASNFGNIAVGTIARDVNLVSASVVAVGESFAASFVATGTTSWVSLRCSNVVGETAIFDNVSVRELPGNHATQGTEPYRPILARVPEGGRRNLLERTEEFDNDAYWTEVNASVSTDGTGQKIVENTANDAHYVQTGTLANKTTAHTIQIEAKAGGRNFLCIQFTGTSVTGTTADRRIWFDIANETVETTGSLWSNAVITSTGGGWYRVEATITRSGTANSFLFLVCDADNSASYTGDGSSGIYLRKAQLEEGSTASAYQRVSSEYDITEAGVTSLEYLAFDGSDDFMTVGTNADWNYLHDGTGSMAAFAVRTAEVANPDDISFVFSTNDANPAARGSYVAADDRSAASRNDAWNIRVSNTTASPTPVFTATNDTISDIDGNSVFVFQHGAAETPDYTFRENGIVVYSGSYGEAPASGNSETALIIGASDTTGANSLNGRLFAAIVRGAASTAQEISDTESYIAAKSGVTIP